MSYFVYIVRCSDQSLYIGVTNNLQKRIDRHNRHQGSWWVEQHGGGEIVFSEIYETLVAARRRERQIKNWSLAKKEALVKRDLELLKNL